MPNVTDKSLPLNSRGNRRGMHPNSRANLRPPVRPGEVLNPKGKNGARGFRALVRAYDLATEDELRGVLKRLIDATKEGEPWAFSLFLKLGQMSAVEAHRKQVQEARSKGRFDECPRCGWRFDPAEIERIGELLKERLIEPLRRRRQEEPDGFLPDYELY